MKFLLQLSATLLLGFVIKCSAQAGTTNLIGGAANGIYASGQFVQKWPDRGDLVSIIIHFSPPSTNVSLSPFVEHTIRTNGITTITDPLRDGKYFRATNSFCGPIELRDVTGGKIPLLKPEVNSQKAYPNTYNLMLVSYLLRNMVGKGPPLPMVISGADAELSFHLSDYFKLEKRGEYQLTVWPKIYERALTNDNICSRIDVPPVTLTISLNSTRQPSHE